MKRIFDLLVSAILFVVLVVPMLLVAALVCFTSKGSSFYFSDRVGANNVIFSMPKFRTMLVDTPPVATHLLKDSQQYLTPVGAFLRKSSLDELPQLWSILKGEMSLVGPRPALFNQDDLIALRTKKGIDKLLPGLTGWAQVNGRDEISVQEKVELDVEYMYRRSIGFDLYIIWRTLIKVVRGDEVSH